MPDRQRPKIFITHSSRDIDFARRLHDDLQAQGFELWLDDKTLQAGHRLAEEINRGLEWCDVYVPVISRASLASKWCWEEINAAISLSNQPDRSGRPTIIPVIAEDVADEMPAMLAARLYINFAGRYDEGLQELVTKGLSHSASVSSAKSPRRSAQASGTAAPQPKRGIPSWILGCAIGMLSVALLLVCGVTLYLALPNIMRPTPTPQAYVSPIPPPPFVPTMSPPTAIPTAVPIPPTIPNPPTSAPMSPTWTPIPTSVPPTRTPAPTWTPVPQGRFIVNQLSSKCIDVKGTPGTANETPLQLWDCESSNPSTDQKWVFTNDGFIVNTLSDRCVDVKGTPGTANETPLQLWDCEFSNPSTDQRWEYTSGGFFRNIRSGKCMDVKGLPGVANESPLQLWDCEFASSSTDQKWVWR